MSHRSHQPPQFAWLRRLSKLAWACGALVAGSAHALEPTPFAYQSAQPLAGPGRTVVQTETSLGTRELRLLGVQGVAQSVGARTTLDASWQAEAWAGYALGRQDYSYGAGLAWQALRAGDQAVDLVVSSALARDYTGTFAPRLAVAASKQLGAWRVAVSGLGELPVQSAHRRDAVDLIVAVGVARRAGRSLTVGLEAAGQDVEGLWDRAEAEGGARLVVGPLAVWQAGPLQVRGHAGAVWSAAAAQSPVGADPGLQVKLAVVWSMTRDD